MKSRKAAIALFILYVLILSWIILFKATIPLVVFQLERSVNVVLFGNEPRLHEIILNVLVFVPMGIFISALKKKGSFFGMVALVFLLSLFYEATQFIFAIGVCDITDLIANTLGGIAGAGMYYVFRPRRTAHEESY